MTLLIQLFIIGVPVGVIVSIISGMYEASKGVEQYCAKYGVPLPRNYQQQYNSNTCMDEAYLLFMGDAVLRSNHPEATATQQEYYNDNHNCEAW